MITEDYRVLTPAYSRDYKNKNEVEKDFRDGKDFIDAITGRYCSIRDFQKGVIVNIRYWKLTKITSIIKV